MPYGYCGKIVRVNLSTRQVTAEERDENFYRRYLGGATMIAHFLLDEVPAGADPLGPDNKLIFALGPVTGLALPGSSRHCIGAKSPLSNAFGKSEAGGFWGAELKRAGWDAIIVEGQADRPVYISVRDGDVEIRDASHLWGQSTKESQEAIRAELGDRLTRVAQIGPAGERQVAIACIINDLHASAGRTGLGAVMGSKNLKAVAVRGVRPQKAASPERIQALAKWVAANYLTSTRNFHELGTGGVIPAFNLTGNLPTRNFRDGHFAEADKITAMVIRDTIRIGMEGCYACPVRCKKVVQASEPFAIDPAYGGPEYETLGAFGSNCGVDDISAICKCHDLCQRYGLDTISTGATIAFAIECFEKGILTKSECDGLELRWGDGAVVVRLVEMIARREGIGNLLADGSARAARAIGRGAEALSIAVKGVELGMHEPRLKAGLGVAYAVAAQGGDHVTGLQDTDYAKEGGAIAAMRTLGVLDPMPSDELSPRKVRLLAYRHIYQQVVDSLLYCTFIPYQYSQALDMLEAATGWQSSMFELMKVGERAVALARAFNVRQGIGPEADRLPSRFFTGTTEGPLHDKGIDAQAFDQAKRTIYGMFGWDESGRPLAAKLHELDLGWAAHKLYGDVAVSSATRA